MLAVQGLLVEVELPQQHVSFVAKLVILQAHVRQNRFLPPLEARFQFHIAHFAFEIIYVFNSDSQFFYFLH